MPPTIALCSKVPLLGNAVEHKMLKSTFPVPEITWAGWKRHQPLCHLSALFARKGLTPWRERQDQAYFSGSLDNGRWRRRLRALVEVQAAGGFHDLAVKDVSSDFFHWSTPRAMRGKGGGRGGSRGGGRGGAKGGDKRVDGRGRKKDPGLAEPHHSFIQQKQNCTYRYSTGTCTTPRHMYAACWRLLLTYLLTYRSKTRVQACRGWSGHRHRHRHRCLWG